MMNLELFVVNTFLSTAKQTPVDLSGVQYFGILIILVGLVSLAFPQAFWHLRVGRKIPGVPPNRLYLLVLRFGGLLVIALGVYVIIYIRQMA
ncbi:MAG: hypothetical protein SCJ94_07680 [Bacillota bacterium]|nr:hypothetical protein [Bacillota bacterium]